MLTKVVEKVMIDGEEVFRDHYIELEHVSDAFVDNKGIHLYMDSGNEILVAEPGDLLDDTELRVDSILLDRLYFDLNDLRNKEQEDDYYCCDDQYQINSHDWDYEEPE